MGEQGKYHGQRLKEKEVLRLYAAGERDFRGTLLRGCNFRRSDLSGADFSGADIRSARFVEASLRGTKFCQAQAGLQRRWWLGQMIPVILISVLAGSLQIFVGMMLGIALIGTDTTIGINLSEFSVGIAGLLTAGFVFFTITRQGFTFKTLGNVTVVFVGASALFISIAIAAVAADAITGTDTFSKSDAIAVIAAIPILVAVTVVTAFVIAFAFAVVIAVAGNVVISVAVAIGITAAFTFTFVNTFLGTFIAVFAIANLLVGIYIKQQVHKSNSKFESPRIIGLAFASFGGTTFSGADLTGTTFSRTYLNNTNFANSRQRPTTLTQVRWHHAQKLDRARLGSSSLQDHRVRLLLTTLNGIDQDLSNADLRGANLANAQLHRANLQGTNLNGAILRGTELQGANLTEASCLNTDFTGADLTGACVEAWNMDSTTCLEAVHCDYIFLRRNEEERRPSSGIFQPGEFTKLFQEVLSTIDLIFQNGVDWQAFTRTLTQVQTQHEAANLSVQSIANKGDGVVVVKLNAAPDADKSVIHQTFMEGYQVALKEAEARYKAQLEAKDEQITIYREKSAEMKGIIEILANRPITIHNEAKAMTNSSDSSRKVEIGNVGGNFSASDSAFNLGDKNSSVSVGGSVIGGSVASGDNNTVSVHYQQATLPAVESVDIRAELRALHEILSQLQSDDKRKIKNALEDAEEELKKPEPDKDEVGQALDRALGYAEKANGFAEAIDKLRPHVEKSAAWLGENWYKLLTVVGLAI